MNALQAPRQASSGYAARPQDDRCESPPETDARLHGRRLVLVRAMCWAVALLTIALFVASLGPHYHAMRTVCAAEPCRSGQRTPGQAVALAHAGLTPGFYAAYRTALAVAFALVWFALAALLVRRRPADRMALFAALVFVLFGASVKGVMNGLAAVGSPWGVAGRLLGVFGFFSFFAFCYLFPDGRFVPRWTRWLTLAAIPVLATATLAPDSPVGQLGNWFALTIVISAIFAQVYRYGRVSGPVRRQQTKWVVCGIVVALVGGVGAEALGGLLLPEPSLASLMIAPTFSLSLLLIPLAIGVAILRYRLYDIDVLINRALVYVALTAIVAGLYVLVVGGAGALFQTGGSLPISFVATSLVAVLFQPLRERVQRRVNRLLYGERDAPYDVLSRLGRRLEEALAPDTALPIIVQTVAEALKLPYAAIALKQDRQFVTIAVAGTLTPGSLHLPIVYQNEAVGELIVAPRAPGEVFSPADRRLLDDLARQAGIAAQAVRLTADLQRSRERLVAAREEERRRLRRDLHDSLGPRLSSLALQLAAARNRVAHDPVAADLLASLKAQTHEAVADIRRLVYALRPPALDELGLVSAIREHAARHAGQGHGVQITVEATDALPPLPAAIEVAAYRIALEALTNVVRHAQADRCLIRLSLDGARAKGDTTMRPGPHSVTLDPALCLEIADDGRGIAPDARTGTGLLSMQERALELGGTLTVEPVPTGGTRIGARLPLPPTEA